jgi:hypothetical protein
MENFECLTDSQDEILHNKNSLEQPNGFRKVVKLFNISEEKQNENR